MKINTKETFSTKPLKVLDAMGEAVSIKIEAAHSGLLNGNYIFYTPKAMKEGAASLKKFYKPIQKKHYSKTLGYIYNAAYEERLNNSEYYKAINEAETPADLVKAVRKYYYSDEYSRNQEGFGVLVAKAKLYDDLKIDKLAHNDKGYVSIAGDSNNALCSVCAGDVTQCSHVLGQRYDQEVCFAIADSLELDHISFEEIPANWKTNTMIISDSKVSGKVEIIEEGNIMKKTIEELKASLVNIDSVLLELGLSEYSEQYKKEAAEATDSDFLFPEEKTVHVNTALGVIVATYLTEQVDNSEASVAFTTTVLKEYTAMFNETPLEDAVKSLAPVIEEVITEPVVEEPSKTEEIIEVSQDVDNPTQTVENTSQDFTAAPEPVVEVSELPITDADKSSSDLVATLSTNINETLNSFKEDILYLLNSRESEEMQIMRSSYEGELEVTRAYAQELEEELRKSLLEQIVFLAQVSTTSGYYTKLQTRTVGELKMTLEDHKALYQYGVSNVVVPSYTCLSVTDSQSGTAPEEPTVVDTVGTDKAVDEMSTKEENTTLEVEDSDKIVGEIVSNLGSKILSKKEYSALYRDTAERHGVPTAKKLHAILKQQFQI